MSDTFENKGALATTIVVAAADSLNEGQANYVCDGVDDHVEIQAALDALPATGGEVLLLDGTYNIEVSLIMDSYQTLRGCGYNTLLTTSTALSGIVTAIGGAGTEKQGIVTADLRIDGASTAYAGIYWDYVDNSEVRNVWVHDCTFDKGVTEWAGIELTNCDFDKLVGNICSDNGLSGIQLGDYIAHSGACTKILIEASECFNNYTSILIYDSDNNTVTGNTCQGNNDGIYLETSDNNTVTGNTCQGNYYGIRLRVSNNNTVTGNTCQGNYYGIRLGISDNNTVTGNTCQGNTDGILIDTSNNNTVTGNTCQGNTDGILIDTSNNNTVTGNTCQGNNGYGILIDTSNNNTVTGNTCLENSQDTDVTFDNIHLVDSDYNLIASNVCRRGPLANKPRYGINISNAACDHNMVHGNNLYDSGSTGDLNDAGTNTHKRDNLSLVGAWLADV
jgi:parallel beta-helix repeat protein